MTGEVAAPDPVEPPPRGRRILRNFATMTTGKVAGDLSTLIVLAAISRVYGEQGLGTYSLAMAIAGFLGVTSNFGLAQLSIKELSCVDRINEQFGRFLAARVAIVLATIVLMLVLVPVAQLSQQIGVALLLIGSSQILFAIGEGFTALMIAREEMHLAAAMALALRLVTMTVVCIGAFNRWPFTVVLLVFPLANLLFVMTTAGLAFKRYGMLRGNPLGQWRATLRAAVPYGTAELLEQFASRIDILLVGMLLGTVAAGAYNAGFRVLFSLNFVAAFAALSILPLLIRMHSSHPQAGQELFSRTLATSMLVAIPAAVGLWLIAPSVINLIFGPGFTRSATILRYLVVLLPLYCMIQFMAMYLMATDRQPVCTRLQWWAAILNTIGNIALIPTIGLIGAAISTIIANVVLLVLFVVQLVGEVDARHIMSRLIIALAGSGVIVGCSIVVDVNYLLFIPVAAVLHLATICAFPTIRRIELARVLALFQRSGAHARPVVK